MNKMAEVRFKTDAKISISDGAVEYARKLIEKENTQNRKLRELIENFTKTELEFEEKQLIGYKKDLEQAKENPEKYQDHIQHCLRSIHAIECMISRYKQYQKLLEESKK